MKTNQMKQLFVISMIGILGLLAIPLNCIAETFPTKPLTMIVPYRAGGGTDTMARVLAKSLKDEVGQPVVVVNRKGGGGSLGASFLKNSGNDGYTFLMGGPDITTWNPLVQKVDFNMTDFRYLAAVTEYQNALVAGSDKPYKTLTELVSYSKEHPGISCAVQTPIDSKAINRIMKREKLDWKIVNTGGGSEVVQLLLGDKIDFAYSGGVHARYPQKLTVLASLNKDRLAGAPDKPSAFELGYEIMIPSYIVFMTPAGVSDEIAKILEEAILKASQSKDFKTIVQDRLKAPVIQVNSESLSDYMPKLQEQMKALAAE